MVAKIAALLALVAPGQVYTGSVIKVIDGDTVKVEVPAWSDTPFEVTSLRISGIDTPESRKPPGKCAKEVKLGKAAKLYAQGLLKPGDPVSFKYISIDKYGGRIDATLQLPDGRDWGTIMIAAGYARPYSGGKKPSYCK